jgi:hypothetical protein
MLFEHLHKNDKGNLEIIVMNNEEMAIFVKKVKHLCSNDPTKYHGQRIHFEFSLDAKIENLVKFNDLFDEEFLIKETKNEL